MHHFDFHDRRILVIGDLMVDKYLDGFVGRISPEAPVPILLSRSERTVLGGAANVAANLASLGASVECIGVIGTDDVGSDLVRLLNEFPNVGTGHLVRDVGRPTTCKTRVMSGLHQLIRIDAEFNASISEDIEAAVMRAFEHILPWAEAVVISDYAKGLCTDGVLRGVIEAAADARKPSIIDPKRRDFRIYRGASILKPNRRELTEATQRPCETDAEAEAAASVAIDQTSAAILLTRSEHGMSYFEPGQKVHHLPTAARDVFDVSGAGDTVMALLALGVASRLPIPETMRLANAAAGIVVSKVGTARVTVAELDAVLDIESHRGGPDKGALVSLTDAARRRAEWRQLGLTVGFTNGCYDLLHPGHVSLLKRAAENCDRLIVAINSDESVQRLKGPTRPVQHEAARAYVLGGLSSVDLVVIFQEDTPAEVIDVLLPDLLVKGADYSVEQVVGAETVRKAGGRVLLVPLIPDQSTTSMIHRAHAPSTGNRLEPALSTSA